MQIKWLAKLSGIKNRLLRKPKPAGSHLPEGCVSDKIVPIPEPKSLGLLVRAMERDYQVKYLKHIITANVSAVRVSVSAEGPGAEDPKAKGIAKKLEELWQKSVVSMMDAYGFGRQAFEKSNAYDPTVPCTYVKNLEPIEFEDSKLTLNPDDHSYDGFKVKISGPDQAEEWVDVEAKNSWWLAIYATPRNPHGKSQYRGAIEQAWIDKRETLRNLRMFVKQYALGGGIVYGPMTKKDEETGQIWSCPDEFQAAAAARETGGWIYMPNDPHTNTDMAQAGKFEYEITESTNVRDAGPILEALDHDDVAILRAGGVPEKAAIEGDGGGSYAMLSQQMLILFALIDSLISQLVASFQDYVADPTGVDNYGEEGGPRFKVSAVKLTNRPDSFVVELLKSLGSNPQFSSMILSGGVNLRSVLESVGLPVSPELEQIAKQVAAQFAATVGALNAGPGGMDGAELGGEFGGLGRRQLTNNFKALQEIIDALIAGTKTPAMAQQSLELLGVKPDRAAKMIQNATDADPTNDQVSMANHLDRQQQMFRKFLGSVKKKSGRKHLNGRLRPFGSADAG